MEICHDVNLDMISNLPDNVIDQILVRLPLRDAVGTSVLSTNWRYKWTTITELVFHDNQLVQLPSPHNDKDKLINFVNLVFLFHTGFIHKFELSIIRLPMISSSSSSMIDAWILFLSRKNIKEFALKFPVTGGGKYKLPNCFFSAQQISTLELRFCVLKKPPPTFTGFSNLKSLYLDETTFVNKGGGFEYLISKCPLLERLTWQVFSDTVDHLNISSPNLKYLCLTGCFKDICFENTPLLSDVSIHTYISDETLNKFLQTETGNVVKVLSSLPNLRKFAAGFYFVEFLTLSKIPEKLPFTCHHLNNLSLYLNSEDVNELCVALCLLNSSPNLGQLEIQLSNQVSMPGHDIQNFWEERTHIDWNMSRLQVVRITSNTGYEFKSLEFIKLLLANSPMLEMLSVTSGKLDLEGRDGLTVSKELLTFPLASPKAKIKFLETHEK